MSEENNSNKTLWTKIETEITPVEFEQLEILAVYNSTSIDKYLRGILRLHLNEKRTFVNSVKEKIQKKIAKDKEEEKRKDFEHKNTEFEKGGKSLFDKTVISTTENEESKTVALAETEIKKIKIKPNNEHIKNDTSNSDVPKVDPKIAGNRFFNRVIPGSTDKKD